jgi:hypothetical protein
VDSLSRKIFLDSLKHDTEKLDMFSSGDIYEITSSYTFKDKEVNSYRIVAHIEDE